MAPKKFKKKTKSKKGIPADSQPTREEILAFVADNPKRNSKRDIAKAFDIKGNARIGLKATLKGLIEDGLIERRGKRLQEPGKLPPVGVIDIVTRDRDGGLLAKPVKWDESELGKPPVIELSRKNSAKGKTAGVGNRVLAKLEPKTGADGIYTASIIKVLTKQVDEILGIVRIRENLIRLIPTIKRLSEFDIPQGMLGDAKDGDLVAAETLKSVKYGLKQVRITRVIGSIASEKAVSMIAIHANEIPYVFPDEVLQEAEKAKSVTPDGREDWRDIPLITIDPADAKDHDDAIYAEPNPDVPGGFIAYVAIADVSAYVLLGSPMDREALVRGNSVYFPDRVVPMLPERISNDLCSLREHEDRPALAVRMIFDSEGRKTKHTFHRILMRSAAKLAYQEAQKAIDGDGGDKANAMMENVLKPLWEAYRCLERGRNNRQPLELDLPERKILLNEKGEVDRVTVPDRLDAHKLVEEFMIQANVCAAETLERRKQKLIYRTHDAPSLAKLESLREFLSSLNMSLARPGNLRAMHFNQILAKVRGGEQEELVNQVVLRSQSQAEYTPDNIGHFGLQLARYAHFTSPIRRYADLIVHRALVGSLGLGPGAITPEEEARLEEIAAAICITERRAMQAERETVDRLIAAHLSERVGDQFSGRINGVTRAGLFVTLDDTGADGFIPISSLSDEYFIHDEDRHALVGEQTGSTFQMGQLVDVKLIEAAPVSGALRFEMMSEGTISNILPRSRNTNRRPQNGRRSGAKTNFGKRRKRH